MDNLISKLNENTKIMIRDVVYIVKTKTWYSIEEDTTAFYIKCELSNNKVLSPMPLMFLSSMFNSSLIIFFRFFFT